MSEAMTQSLGQQCRHLVLQELQQKLQEAPTFLVTTYTTMSVSKIESLRRQLSKSAAKFEVVKKTLARKALQANQLPDFVESCTETLALVFVNSDAAAVSKIVVNYAKDNEQFKIVGGVLERQYVTIDGIRQLAELPPRPVLLAKVCGGMKAPMGRLVGVLQGTIRRFTLVVQAIKEQQEKN